MLRANGVRLAADQSPARNIAIACPALPTCGKALGEAERVLPDVVDDIEKLLADTGNVDLPLSLNMSGCPNGCSRPYTAELGIVGRTKKNYDIFVGGSPAGDRLARLLRADVPLGDLAALLRPLLERLRPHRSFGDVRRLGRRRGLGRAASLAPRPHRPPRSRRSCRRRHRLMPPTDTVGVGLRTDRCGRSPRQTGIPGHSG